MDLWFKMGDLEKKLISDKTNTYKNKRGEKRTRDSTQSTKENCRHL